MKTLWSTIVGSHMWKMNHPGSDMDIFTCHIVPTKALLMGADISKSIATRVDDVDMSNHEIGKVVHMVAQGNVNFIWGLTSPEIVPDDDTSWRQRLIDIYSRNMARNCYHSINGLFKHNYHDYIVNVEVPDPKKLKIIARTLNFGINILKNKKIVYAPVEQEISVTMLDTLDEQFETAYKDSSLPDLPNTKEYMQFLYEIRICELMDML